MFIVVSVYFVIESVRKLLDTPSYESIWPARRCRPCSDLRQTVIMPEA